MEIFGVGPSAAASASITRLQFDPPFCDFHRASGLIGNERRGPNARKPLQLGACWLALMLWRELQLDQFWSKSAGSEPHLSARFTDAPSMATLRLMLCWCTYKSERGGSSARLLTRKDASNT